MAHLAERFGRDTLNLLAVVSANYLAGEVGRIVLYYDCLRSHSAMFATSPLADGSSPYDLLAPPQCSAQELYDLAFDMLQGDTEVGLRREQLFVMSLLAAARALTFMCCFLPRRLRRSVRSSPACRQRSATPCSRCARPPGQRERRQRRLQQLHRKAHPLRSGNRPGPGTAARVRPCRARFST